MELSLKLQELRKQKNLTQEELAEMLYVSRAAVSKWEQGRGYPSIDSLKAISRVFSVSIDELLSGEEVMNIAEQENLRKEKHFIGTLYGLLDLSVLSLLLLPLFAQRTSDSILAVPLLSLSDVNPYLKISCIIVVAVLTVSGVLQFCLIRFPGKGKISLILNIMGTALFIISLQPYAAIYLLVMLFIKIFVPGHK